MIELTKLVFWYWFSFGIFLLVLELLGATGFFLWIGIASLLTGAIVWLLPNLVWYAQVTIFALLAVLHTAYWWRFTKNYSPKTKDHPKLNQRGQQYIGKECIMLEPIQNGEGKVRLGDTVWTVTADHDIPKNKKVRVIDANGTVLKVE